VRVQSAVNTDYYVAPKARYPSMQQPMAKHCTLNNFPDSTDLVHKALARPDSLASFSRLDLM